jgi:hypothetical protein
MRDYADWHPVALLIAAKHGRTGEKLWLWRETLLALHYDSSNDQLAAIGSSWRGGWA